MIRDAQFAGQSWVTRRPGRKGDLVAEVIVGGNETFEAALRRFTKRVQQDGVLAEARRREHFEKPRVKRKQKEAAKRRNRK
jgi:small subunit ribosomal protein S21